MPEQLFTEKEDTEPKETPPPAPTAEPASTLYALPPPMDAPAPERISRGYALQRFVCIFCAATAIFALLLCALQKLDEIFSRGFWEYLSEELLCVDGEPKTLGDRMSEVAFGDFVLDAEEKEEINASLQASIALPRIYYIPKEQIADEIYYEQEELEKKMFALYSFDYSKVPSGAYPIIPTDLSTVSATDLKNDTTYAVDMQEISKAAKLRAAEFIPDEPLVLIVHTHGTESFSAEDSICYGDNFNNPRSEDVSENIVAVGETLCEALNKKGIPTIHCETMHDKESYISAYERSAESIQYYLQKYPSIRYVFDVHRDSLIRSDLTKLRPVTLRGGKPCAQLMMIVGSDEKGAGEYDWKSNLILAEAIQQHLCGDTLGVPRQLYLRGASYNQQYAKYGLLLEIGSCGNSLSEAKEAALAFADAFEKVLKTK